jgi:hypothetical protein
MSVTVADNSASDDRRLLLLGSPESSRLRHHSLAPPVGRRGHGCIIHWAAKLLGTDLTRARRDALGESRHRPIRAKDTRCPAAAARRRRCISAVPPASRHRRRPSFLRVCSGLSRRRRRPSRHSVANRLNAPPRFALAPLTLPPLPTDAARRATSIKASRAFLLVRLASPTEPSANQRRSGRNAAKPSACHIAGCTRPLRKI